MCKQLFSNRETRELSMEDIRLNINSLALRIPKFLYKMV